MPTTIIDADSIVYKAGFAVERNVYELVAEDGDGDLVSATFDDKEAAGCWIHSIGADPAEVSIEAAREVEPVENAIQIVKTMLDGICTETKCKDPIVVLSGPTNYRDRVGKVRRYKGNRDKAHKPVHYDAMRTYMYERWGAEFSDGERYGEADDLVSCFARCEPKAIIAAIDKDLDQIPGRHYNYSQKVWYDVSEGEANFWFYRQVLTGDASDNVGGVYRMGPRKAEAWLADAPDSDEDFWQHIVRAYQQSQGLAGCPYADKVAEDVAIENAQLVYLQRVPGELWLPLGRRGRTSDV